MPGKLPVACNESIIVEPEPFVPPEAPVCDTVHVKVAPVTLLLNPVVTIIPEHTVCADGAAIAVGVGLTVITTVTGAPVHPFAVGVME